MRLWPTRRAAASKRTSRWDLSTPLLNWSRNDVFTIRDSLAGTLVLGATGAGKSTGSGQTIALSMLRAGYGALVLTAKPDERSHWERMCALAGRSDELVIFGADSGLVFNPFDHELQYAGAGAGLTENLVSLFSAVLEVAERSSGSGSGGLEEQGYWARAGRQLMRNAIDLLVMAKGTLSVSDLYRVVISAPTSFEQLRSTSWQERSYCYQCLQEADAKHKSPERSADFQMVTDYLCIEFPELSPRTRSVIVSTFTSMVDVLNRGVLRKLFAGESNVTPELASEGKILLIDLPVKEYAQIGLFAQVMFKHAFQRSMERRRIDDATRPVVLWADEAQYFVTSQDMQFATTCRGARVALTLLTQNVSNFEAALGSEAGKAETASLFANLNSKIFHANGDPVTNEWASTLIGRTRQHFINTSSNRSDEDWVASTLGLGSSGQQSAGMSESYEFEVQPRAFSQLRTGGPDNGWEVDAVLFQNGRRFAQTGSNWLPITFNQRSQ